MRLVAKPGLTLFQLDNILQRLAECRIYDDRRLTEFGLTFLSHRLISFVFDPTLSITLTIWSLQFQRQSREDTPEGIPKPRPRDATNNWALNSTCWISFQLASRIQSPPVCRSGGNELLLQCGHSSNKIATNIVVNFWIIVLNLTVFRKHIARQSSTIHRQQATTIPQGNLPQ